MKLNRKYKKNAKIVSNYLAAPKNWYFCNETMLTVMDRKVEKDGASITSEQTIVCALVKVQDSWWIVLHSDVHCFALHPTPLGFFLYWME